MCWFLGVSASYYSLMLFGIDLAHLIQILGYPGIFAIILAESGLFFAVSLPGASLLFTSGFLASQGFLNIYILLAIVLTAAILGDSIGYWFGAWVGPALFKREDSRFFKKAYLRQTHDFFEKHGTKTILLARFIPIVRTFAPILAGVGAMQYRTFLFYNVLGALIWGGGFTFGGYFLGHSIPGIEHYLEYIIIGIILVTMLPIAYEIFKQKMAKQGSEKRFNLFQPTTEPRERLNLSGSLPRAIIFDMDDTLADSFVPPSDTILDKLLRLSQKIPIAIMSGAAYARMERDILSRIPKEPTDAHWYVFSDSAAQCHAWEHHEWREKYNFPLTDSERMKISTTLKDAVRESKIFSENSDTSRILERDTSVAFTALPDGASQAEKRAWDPTSEKRQKMITIVKTKLPEYEVLIGGKTTVDVTRLGMTKAHGVEWLAKELRVHPSDMRFIGDGFYEGGNDAVVIPTGIQTRQISSPSETEEVIDALLAKF